MSISSSALLVKIRSKFFSRFALYQTEPKAKFNNPRPSRYSKKHVKTNFIQFIFRVPQPFFLPFQQSFFPLMPSTFNLSFFLKTRDIFPLLYLLL